MSITLEKSEITFSCGTKFLQAADHVSQADPILGQLISKLDPPNFKFERPDFESLVTSIVYQQLSERAASTIYKRFRESLGCEESVRLQPSHIYLKGIEDLRAVGLSRQKASYILDLSAQAHSGKIDFSLFPNLEDQQVVEKLTQVKGIGPWTAHMFLMFCLGRPDVLPTVDLGIRSATQKVYGLSALPKPAEIEQIAEPWKPFRTAACFYLWKSLDKPNNSES